MCTEYDIVVYRPQLLITYRGNNKGLVIVSIHKIQKSLRN